MASPEFMSHPYMCSLCFDTIKPGEHRVDRDGQKWDSHQQCHDDDVLVTFKIWAGVWRAETGMMSSVTDMCRDNKTYQQIIGLGWDVVPHIIEDLRHQPEHWFVALKAITGEDPAAGTTTIAAASQRWINWWETQHGPAGS